MTGSAATSAFCVSAAVMPLVRLVPTDWTPFAFRSLAANWVSVERAITTPICSYEYTTVPPRVVTAFSTFCTWPWLAWVLTT